MGTNLRCRTDEPADSRSIRVRPVATSGLPRTVARSSDRRSATARLAGVVTRFGMLPNWIIAGVPKAGTSTLFRWLTDHPEVSGPSEKETCYFVDRGSHMFRPDRNFL